MQTSLLKAAETSKLATEAIAAAKESVYRSSYRALRRAVIRLNVLVALAVMFAPSILWFNGRNVVHPGVCAVGAVGIVWMFAVCTWLDGLADSERQ